MISKVKRFISQFHNHLQAEWSLVRALRFALALIIFVDAAFHPNGFSIAIGLVLMYQVVTNSSCAPCSIGGRDRVTQKEHEKVEYEEVKA